MDEYERTELVITEFDAEDVITTSDISPIPSPPALSLKYDKYEGYMPW